MLRALTVLVILSALFTLTKPLPYSRQIDFAKLQPKQWASLAPFKTPPTAFNQAPEIGHFINLLKKDFGIEVAVETGTYRGETTRFFSSCFNEVHTIELNPDSFQFAQENLKDCHNIHYHLGSSEKILSQILPNLHDKRILFYLDAHWNDYCPLLEELGAIATTHRDRCIIVIDDFKVPHRPDCHYDQYGDVACTYKCIQKHLDSIYSSYEYYYVIPKDPMSRAKFVAIPKSWGTKKGTVYKKKFQVASDLIKNVCKKNLS